MRKGAEVAPWFDSRERAFRPGKSGRRWERQSADELLLVEDVELDDSEPDELDDSEPDELDSEFEDDEAVEVALFDPWSFL